MKILRIEFEHVPLFEKRFGVDFIASRNVNRQDRDKLFRISEKLYLNPVIALTGINASGKTTVLNLLIFAMKLLQGLPLNQIRQKDCLHLKQDTVIVRTWFQQGSDVWRLETGITRGGDPDQEIVIKDEKLDCYSGGTDKPKSRLFEEASYKPVSVRQDYRDYLAEDQSMILPFRNRSGDRLYISDYMDFVNHNNLKLVTEFPEELLAFLDPSIEYLKFDVDPRERQCEGIRLKFRDSDEIILSSPVQLEAYLSSGTIKGLGLFVSALVTMMKGGYLFVDELENHFNPQITAALIQFMMDPEINRRGATLVFSTHYPLLLDEFDRNDAIYLLRHEKRITLTRLDEIFPRKDMKKSEAFISGYLEGSTPDYLPYQNLGRALAKTAGKYDRR